MGKKEKAFIAQRVIERIHESGGRFLKRDGPSMELWVEVPKKKALMKTAQALREGLDVRHKTVRPEKILRRESSTDNPRKRATCARKGSSCHVSLNVKCCYRTKRPRVE